MKTHLSSFLFAIVIFFICIPCYSSNGFLWKVTGNGIAAPSYILGTESTTSIDVVKQTDFFHICWDSISQVITTCSVPLQETVDNNQIMENLRKLGKHNDLGKIYMDSITSYEKLYSPHQVEFIDSMITKYMPPLSKIRVVPFYLWNYFLQREDVINIDKAEKGKTLPEVYHEMMNWMEIALERSCKQEGKSYLSLENSQDEFKVIDEIDSLERSVFTVKEQATIFYQKMQYKHLYPSSSTFDKLLKELYKKNNFEMLDSLYAIDDQQLDSLNLPKDLKDRLHTVHHTRKSFLIENRTNKWLPTIIAGIQQSPTLIAVDVKHLLGQNGLLNLLRENGYCVESVYNKNIK